MFDADAGCRNVLKTNFYQPTKVALSFRLAPDFLPEVEYPKKPFRRPLIGPFLRCASIVDELLRFTFRQQVPHLVQRRRQWRCLMSRNGKCVCSSLTKLLVDITNRVLDTKDPLKK